VSDSEKSVQIEVPESSVPAIEDFIERRKAGNPTGLVLGVPLPDFGCGGRVWAVYELAERRWVILSEKQ
jgi:hypothetical protein